MPATTTTEAVLAALDDQPDATTAELSAVTGLGRSTVGKALVALEHARRVRRTRGGRERGRRRPDRWTTRPAGDKEPRADGRLRRGVLRALVAEHLRQHAEVEHTPTGVAKALGRSAGAVSNALDRLAADGAVEQTSITPRRFRHHR